MSGTSIIAQIFIPLRGHSTQSPMIDSLAKYQNQMG